MFPGSVLYAAPLLFASVLTAGLAAYAYGRRELTGALLFAGMCSALAVWCAVNALEYLSPTFDGKLLAAKLQYAALVCVSPLTLAFALVYTQRGHWLTGPVRVLLTLPNVAFVALAFSNEWHGLVWARATLDPSGRPGLIFTHGPATYLYAPFSYCLILGGIACFLHTLLRSRSAPHRWAAGVMLATYLLPLLTNIIYFTGFSPLPGFNFTAFAYGISALLMLLAIVRFRFLDLAPIAARMLIENLPDAVVVLDSNNRVIDLNPAARRLFNAPADAVGQTAADLLPPAALQAGPPASPGPVELTIPHGGDLRWYEVVTIPLTDSRGGTIGRVLQMHDHTHERALLKMRDDLTQMIAHDLHNPLSAIYVALDVIGVGDWTDDPDSDGRPATEREALRIAYQSSLRAQDMVDGLLATARLESGQMPVQIKPLDLEATTQAVVRQMRQQAALNQIALGLDVESELGPVLADAGLLDRMLRNLIGNALKFIPAGASITVTLRAEGPHARVTVADTGPGLPPALMPRLFDKFARGDVTGRGHGLGLAFCKMAVETMNGRIWAENPPGQGAVFHFTLPFSPPAP